MAHKIFDEAQIMAAYTLNSWFVTFSPWFEGDSMVIEFVKKGTKGKKTIPVYVSLKEFEKLSKAIKDGSFRKTLMADTETDNPSAWSYRTGTNGSKTVSIGLGKVNSKTGKRSVVVHGYDANKPQPDRNADVPVSYDILEELVSNYELIVGKKPEDNVWHRMLFEAFWEAYEKKKQHYKKGDEDEETLNESPEAVQESAPEDEKAPKAPSNLESDVTLVSYKKEGDVISFDGTIEGKSAVFRISNAELAGKDKQAWKKASSDMANGKVDLRLKLRHVRNGEYTILGIAG